VAGAVDGGATGAVIGGLLGAAGGVIGSAAVWGVSALAGSLGGYIAQNFALGMVAGLGLTGALLPIIHGNWDGIAAVAAGFVGGYLGTMLGNAIMMQGFWRDVNSSSRLRAHEREIQVRVGTKTADFRGMTYGVNMVSKEAYGEHHPGHIDLNPEALGNDYLHLLKTQGHELGHEVQSQMLARGEIKQSDWDYAWATYGQDMMKNPYQRQAENFGLRMLNWSPIVSAYPGAFAQFLLPQVLSLSLPTTHDNRKQGEDFWRDSDPA
jgi:hypothetical protein